MVTFDSNSAHPDLVGGRGQISAAIVDLSTTRLDKSFPESYQSQLQTQPGQQFSQPREIPTWGDIFSEFCFDRSLAL